MPPLERDEFESERARLNEIVLRRAGINVKKFYGLDEQVYSEGALSKKQKELMGLVASLVMRCEECVKYHLVRCHDEGVDDKELYETVSLAMVVGGSITIPHIRKAYDFWEAMDDE